MGCHSLHNAFLRENKLIQKERKTKRVIYLDEMTREAGC